MRTRTYFCDCGSMIEMQSGQTKKCDCGHIFGSGNYNPSNYVNMRNKWTKGTKVEFTERSMDDYIKENK